MKTKGEKIMNKFLITAKLGMLAMGLSAVLCVPHIVLAAHGQAHSDHIRAFSHSMGYLAEKENRAKEQLENTAKETDLETQIIIASDEKKNEDCSQKTDDTDNR